MIDDNLAAADSNGSSWLHCRMHRSISGFCNDVVEGVIFHCVEKKWKITKLGNQDFGSVR